MRTIKALVLFGCVAVMLASTLAVDVPVRAADDAAVIAQMDLLLPSISFGASPHSLHLGNLSPSSRGVVGLGEAFPIANSSEHAEGDSSVAYGSGQFAVAYARNGDIDLAFVSEDGVLENTFLIDSDAAVCGHPEVAYEASSGLFVVAWHCDVAGDGSDYDTRFAAVSPTVGRLGAPQGLGTESDEMFPAVACNPTDGSCLIAVEANSGAAIRGVYVNVAESGIVWVSEPFALTDTTNGYRPHLAWGGSAGTYLLTYTWQNDDGEAFPYYRHIADSWSNPPILYDADFVADVTFSEGYDKSATDVAYDPCTDKFIIVFEYDWAGNQLRHNVWIAIIHAAEAQRIGLFEVASTAGNEYGGVISFISGDPDTVTCQTMDKLVLAYRNDEIGVLAVELQGNHDPLAPAYTFDPESNHHIDAGNSESEAPLMPSIAGGSGQVLVTYTSRQTDLSDADVWGKLLAASFRSYLPLLIK